MTATSISATSGTVVGANVPSATTVSTAACLPNDVAATQFGLVTPNSSPILTGCTVTFGSSNASSQLRMYQSDRRGRALNAPTTGDPDPGWGVASQISFNDTAINWSAALAIDNAGRAIGSNNSSDLLTRRFLPDGSVDPGYGVAGVLAAPPFPTSSGQDDSEQMMVDQAGRLIMVGMDYEATRDSSFIARATPDGAWDASFGSGGVVVVDHMPGGDDRSMAVDEDRSGRYVVLSLRDLGATREFVVSRYRPDGTLDGSFGVSGHVVVPWSVATSYSRRHRGSITVLADDRIVVTGNGTGPSTTTDFAATRLLVDGSTDTTFGTGGTTFVDAAGSAEATRGGAIDDRGRIYMVAARGSTSASIAVVRLLASGMPDASWGPGGVRIHPTLATSIDGQMALMVGGDGTVTLGGLHDTGTGHDGFVTRYLPDGTLDPSWGVGGTTLSGLAGNDAVRWIVPWTDGGMLVSSYDNVDANQRTRIRSYASVGIDDWDASTRSWFTAPSMFAACLKSLGTGTTAGTWVPDANADCTTTDTGWNAISIDSSAAAAFIAASPSGTTTAAATIQFGLKVAGNQAQGRYLAPIGFEVVAP